MKFRSPTQDPVHLALTSGHTHVVGPELGEVDDRFRKEAIAQGCLPEGVGDDEESEESKAFDRKKVIGDALNSMLSGNDPADFTQDGKPSIARLSAKAGFQVSRSEADAVWAEVSKA